MQNSEGEEGGQLGIVLSLQGPAWQWVGQDAQSISWLLAELPPWEI